MSRIRDIANLFSANTDAATDAEVTAAISAHNTSANGHVKRGNTASRPASPSTGDLYYDTTINNLIKYNGTAWIEIAPVPGAPTIGTATTTGFSGQATVTFTGPTNTTVYYTVTSSPGNVTSTGESSPITISGLNNGTAYTFTVTATNANGTSTASAASNSVTPVADLSADILVVAGGGGAAGAVFNSVSTGGAGAGGLLLHSNKTFAYGTNLTVTVGAGGPGGTGSAGTKGSNSQFYSYTLSEGGGRSIAGTTGGAGGSGAGGDYGQVGGAGTSGQGNNGGEGSTGNFYAGGGGGGAGALGGNARTSPGTYGSGGHGGVGTSTYSTWGSATTSGQNVSGTYYFSGGGGGGAPSGGGSGGDGGSGGGGAGVASATTPGGSGTTNTGGGGGGTGYGAQNPNATGGSGGSGIVILRTLGSYTAAATTGSPTRHVTGGYTYYKWTQSGSITI